MTKQDVTMSTMPEVDFDQTAFTGTSDNTPDYERDSDIDANDRGDEVTEETADFTPSEKTPEEAQPPAEDEVKPEETDEEAAEEKPEETSGTIETDTDAEPEENEARVPYNRFKKELEKRRALEEQLAKMQEELPQATTPDIDVDVDFAVDQTKVKAMNDALLEGNSEAASAIFMETIKSAMQSAANAAAKAATEKTYEAARQGAENELQSRNILHEATQAAEIVMGEYDVFNDGSDKFDEVIFNEAIRVRDGLVATGMGVGEAILEAADLVAARHGHQPKSTVKAPVSKPAVKAPNVKAKLEQAAKTPPRVGGEPHDVKPEINVMSMSDEEFDKLDAKEIARLRGDFA